MAWQLLSGCSHGPRQGPLVVAIWLIVIGVFEIVSSFGIRNASRRMEKALAGGPPPAA